ncbi:hypothetical protein GH714_008175 [Hevea brasiliensis]|uniref:Calcium-dependent protein kinase n=1 Tax=Hevea brasiliensis TaxID=3981 RepID=A0A6A6KJN6_HEVBR|nr:hypothetical protein GH714_008175 [Hevea brasiliensis]
MGNCCRSPAAVAREDVKSNFSGHDHAKKDAGAAKKAPITVLTDVTRRISKRKSYWPVRVSKRKLRTAVDIEDVRREVAIMKHLPKNSSIVSLKEACEDDNAVHLVMELCEGGELFDRIVARGHYTERAAAAVTRTIVEVVQLCHKHGVIHRDLKPENFLFANKKENSPLKAIDFGLSIFFKPAKCTSNTESEQGVAQAILRGIIDFKRDPWPNISESAKSLVKQMLEPDPKLRLTAKQVLGIPFNLFVASLPRYATIAIVGVRWFGECFEFCIWCLLVLSVGCFRNYNTRLGLEHPWLQNAKKAPNVPLGDVVKSRLKQFSMMNRFKRKALRVIADFLSIEEVEDIKEMFRKMDTDNDGIVSIEELKAGLRNFNSQLAESEVQMLIEAAVNLELLILRMFQLKPHSSNVVDCIHLDANGKGTLDYGEFVAVSLHLQRMANDEHLRKAFSCFDKDGNGYIEPDELRDALMEDGADDLQM